MHSLSIAFLLTVTSAFVLSACTSDSRSPSAPSEVADDEPDTLARLKASQSESLGIPPHQEMKLVTLAAAGHITWAQLSDDQLLAWNRAWESVLGTENRPVWECERIDTEGNTHQVNFFDLGPREGFCVAYAFRMVERLENEMLARFLEDLEH